MITEWQDLVGRTIKKVTDSPYDGVVLVLEDGEHACIRGAGEELHGAHWPILSEDAADIRLITGASDAG